MAGLIVHEWVEKSGGSERVVDEILSAYPDADLQVLWSDAPGRFPVPTFETWIARTPLRRHKALALPLLPLTWRAVQAQREYDWIVASSHLFAHHVAPRGLTRAIPKFSYVHTPARYIWEPSLDRRGGSPVVRLAASALKPLDRRRARESTLMAANSMFTRERIRAAWDVDASVIYPPVDVDRIRAVRDWRSELSPEELRIVEGLPNGYLLGASRFVSYKRLELVIEAGAVTGLPVVLAGSGPEEQRLRAAANQSGAFVTFVGAPSDPLLYALYQKAAAFVFLAIEDFGIMPVEAMAAGTPVIGPSEGGVLESVGRLEGGAILTSRSPSDWKSAVSEALAVDRVALSERSLVFSAGRFRSEVSQWVEEGVRAWTGS